MVGFGPTSLWMRERLPQATPIYEHSQLGKISTKESTLYFKFEIVFYAGFSIPAAYTSPPF